RYLLDSSERFWFQRFRQRLGCGDAGHQLGIALHSLPPRFALQEAEGTPRRHAEGPGAKRSWMAQVPEILEDSQRDLLQHVVRVRRPDHWHDEGAKRPVVAAKQCFQRVPVAVLGEGDEHRVSGVLALAHLIM